MTQTICQDQRITWEDGLVWKITLTATPGVGVWNIKATLTRNGRNKERHGRWSARTGWNPTMWRPMPDSRTHAIAVDWLKANPVPVAGAGLKP
jgi:hypothetical protein